jgi:hypothetical protein
MRCLPLPSLLAAQSCPLHVRRPVSVSISERGYTATHTASGVSSVEDCNEQTQAATKSYSGLGCDRRSICRGRVSGTKDARRICMEWYWSVWGGVAYLPIEQLMVG